MNHPTRLPLVFLDIDDVLCMSSPYGGYDVIEAVAGRHINPQAVYRSIFVPRAREALKQGYVQLGGEVRFVISSTWREFFDRTQLQQIFRRGGLEFVADRMHDERRWCTPVKLGRGKRVDEIGQWLDEHHQGEAFAVIDDSFSGPSLRPALTEPSHRLFGRVVLCEECVGLQVEHVVPILEALRRPGSLEQNGESP